MNFHRELSCTSIHHKRSLVDMPRLFLETMRQDCAKMSATFGLLALLGASSTFMLSFGADSNDVGVYLVELYRTNEVLVHLNTAPSKTNILQYTSSLNIGSSWSNLYTAPILPFTNHYVIVDTRAAPQRFY